MFPESRDSWTLFVPSYAVVASVVDDPVAALYWTGIQGMSVASSNEGLLILLASPVHEILAGAPLPCKCPSGSLIPGERS